MSIELTFSIMDGLWTIFFICSYAQGLMLPLLNNFPDTTHGRHYHTHTSGVWSIPEAFDLKDTVLAGIKKAAAQYGGELDRAEEKYEEPAGGCPPHMLDCKCRNEFNRCMAYSPGTSMIFSPGKTCRDRYDACMSMALLG
jgi:hypothetical protein